MTPATCQNIDQLVVDTLFGIYLSSVKVTLINVSGETLINHEVEYLQTILIDKRKKEVSTKLWYSPIGHLATHWLSPFAGVARACLTR